MREEGRQGAIFSFFLPWNDSSETEVSLSRYLHKPAGRYGHVSIGPDGHFYVGGQRIRFLGVSVCASSAFPTRSEAEAIAARLAKFGINIVRFHHMDAFWVRFNIFQGPGTRRLNPVALDRLDYFIAKLKENGIYVNLNLLVSRRLTAADGLPPEIEKVDWKDQQALGFFVNEVRQLHKEYARQLLLHRNPYTNTTYAEEPAVAFVEIMNEQGLIHSWLGGVLDRLPEVFLRRLRDKWNRWLLAKYGSTEAIERVWGGGPARLGEEVLGNPAFERGLEGWVVWVHGEAQASYRVVEESGVRALEVSVRRRGAEGWHVQFNYPRIRVVEGEVYLVRFAARAKKEATIVVCLMQAHEPWRALSNVVALSLTPEWRTYEVWLEVFESGDNARLDVSGLGAVETTYYFANFSMRPVSGPGLGEGESLEAGTVEVFRLAAFYSRSPAARRDWVEFLWELERDYFLDMYRYLKEVLGVKALAVGTIVGCSTPTMMSSLDVISAHPYWQHPIFPGTPWDPMNWYVVNEPMVNHPLEGTIQLSTSRRVLGKPFSVSEYNHPAPNMYDAEAYILLSVYAALQDWDAIYAFDYKGPPWDTWDAKRIREWFDVGQHPTKMVTLLLAHLIFVRGDVEPAKSLVTLPISREVEVDLVRRGRVWSWDLPGAHHLAWNPATPLLHRFALEVNGTSARGALTTTTTTSTPTYTSDNGQVTWNCSERGRCYVIVDTPRTVAAVGFVSNRTLDFKRLSLRVEPTLLQGFAVVGASSLDGAPLEDSKRVLLVAVGWAGNAGMELRDYDTGRVVTRVVGDEIRGYSVSMTPFNGRLTCAGTWGTAPTVVEGVRVRVRVRSSTGLEVWALDNTGARRVRVPVKADGEWWEFEVSPEYRTIWYLIVRS